MFSFNDAIGFRLVTQQEDTNAKIQVFVGVFSGAEMGEKTKALIYLRRVDPSNSTKYDKLVKN